MPNFTKLDHVPINRYKSGLIDSLLSNDDTGYLENVPWSSLPKNAGLYGDLVYTEDVAIVLCGLGLEKYADRFKEENISLDIMLTLTEEDFELLGIERTDRDKILSYRKNASSIETLRIGVEDDIEIIKNATAQSLKMDSSIDFFLKRIKKHSLRDYFITDEMKASQVLQTLAEKAIQQTEQIKTNLLEFPSIRSCIANNEKTFRRKVRFILTGLSTVGLCSLVVLFIARFS